MDDFIGSISLKERTLRNNILNEKEFDWIYTVAQERRPTLRFPFVVKNHSQKLNKTLAEYSVNNTNRG
jgi:hypothetical protein